MKPAIKGAMFVLALAGAPLAIATAPAQAAVDFGITLGPNVAFAYQDGYWDRDHHWHRWGRGEAAWYRAHYHDHYYGWRHDRDRHDRNVGWREEHWW